jgi:hypothetical protein
MANASTRCPACTAEGTLFLSRVNNAATLHRCPTCGSVFTVRFDVGDLIGGDLASAG